MLALSACGGGSPSGGGSEAPAENAGSGGLTEITVGVIPIVDTAPIWLGDEKGFFAEEGLELDLQTATGGAAIVPGVVSGSFDFAFSNLISVMVANDKGLDLQFVANGASTIGEEGEGFGAVVVPEDSDVQSAGDLEGKTVSVNNLSNIGDTTIKHVVEQDGGNPENIDFVEVAFPDAPAALQNGQVDAAWILDPFLTQARSEGARVVSWNFTEMHPELDIAGYFTTSEKVQSEPELTEKFTRAMNKSLEYAQENPQEVRDIVGTYTEIDAETLTELTLPEYRPEFSREAAQTLGEAATKYGTLSEAPNLDELLP
jgi:NitT/TauT family transport system substrate-binding protein